MTCSGLHGSFNTAQEGCSALLEDTAPTERKRHLSEFFHHQVLLGDSAGAHLTNEIFETAPGDFIIILLESFCQVRVKNFHADLRKLLEYAR